MEDRNNPQFLANSINYMEQFGHTLAIHMFRALGTASTME